MDSTISQSFKFDIAGSTAELEITSNPFGLDINKVFSMAVRENTKRRFLFVSKLLGKHIPVNPNSALATGTILGILYSNIVYKIPYNIDDVNVLLECLQNNSDYQFQLPKGKFPYKVNLPESNIFIGFAETATALGHSVFSTFSNNCYYIHTTRESNIKNIIPSLLKFDEEHSHAILHKLYPIDKSIFESNSPVVLIDDEITTGKSCLNLIENIQGVYPRNEYTVLTILDWRTSEHKELFATFENLHKIKINVVSLISGNINFNYKENKLKNIYVNQQITTEDDEAENKLLIKKVVLDDFPVVKDSSHQIPYLTYTGRFGISTHEIESFENIINNCAKRLEEMRDFGKTLCLGTSEFMYLPMILASQMGKGIYFHSTTRSPIFSYKNDSQYGISNAYKFNDFYDDNIIYYLYNIPINAYEEVFLFFERDILDAQLENIKFIFSKTSIKQVNIVVFSTS